MSKLRALWLMSLLVAMAALSSPRAHAGWAAAWQAPQSDAFASVSVDRATLRQVLTSHAPGSTLRVRFSNQFCKSPVKIGAASIGHAKGGAEVAGTPTSLTFNGKASIELAAGQVQYSDPASLTVETMQRLTVSVYVDGAVSALSRHFTGNEFVWRGKGNLTHEPLSAKFDPINNTLLASHVLVDRIEIDEANRPTAQAVRVVAMFGDSITDGFMGVAGLPLPSTAPIGQDTRYPDFLQRRAQQKRLPLAFVSAAISGNRLLAGPALPMFGPPGNSRVQRDVLSLPGVTDAIVLIGINDLGFSMSPAKTGQELIQGLATVVQQLKGAGLRVMLGTLTPALGTTYGAAHGRAVIDEERNKVNAWIRSSGYADAVVDFDACLRDPANPSRLLPAYDSGDHLHPSAAGYNAMAECVDLTSLR